MGFVGVYWDPSGEGPPGVGAGCCAERCRLPGETFVGEYRDDAGGAAVPAAAAATPAAGPGPGLGAGLAPGLYRSDGFVGLRGSNAAALGCWIVVVISSTGKQTVSA